MPKRAQSDASSTQPVTLTHALVLSGLRFYVLCFFAEHGDTGTLADLQADICRHSGELLPLPSLYTVVWRLETMEFIEQIGELRTSVSRGKGQILYRITPTGRRLLVATRDHCHRLANHVDRVLV